MKHHRLLFITALLTSISTAETTQNPETLFDNKCSICHTKTRPSDMSSLVAPPIMGVMRHVKMRYPTKEEAVPFIVDYVLAPSKTKALCMPNRT